jgi:hypothetical protein
VLVVVADVRRRRSHLHGWIGVQVLRIRLVPWLRPAIFGVGAVVLGLVWWGGREALFRGFRPGS